ncbi:MAG: DUF1292 domain-containing protein [Eubacteriales bacterium]
MSNPDDSTDKPYSFSAEDMTVTLSIDEGEVECAIVVILTIEEQDYMVLLPLDENGENQEGEVWFYRYFENEDIFEDPDLEYIESDEELDAISDLFEQYLSSSEFDEYIDDDDDLPLL